MSFITDKQTLDDLNIFGKRGHNSVYALFNRTGTRGGAELLEQMFRYPLDNADAINRRSGIIRFFQQSKTQFPFRSDWFDAAEHYLSNTDDRSRLGGETDSLGRKFRSMIGSDTEYELLHKGASAVHHILCNLKDFTASIKSAADGTPYKQELDEMTKLLEAEELQPAFKIKPGNKLSFQDTSFLDKLLRFQQIDKVKKLLYYIYNLDVYISVANVATARNFVFPEALETSLHTIRITNVYHPHLEGAVPNSITITPDSNIIFLTGANMAGKSTFMKSLGIALFLAHMGFPVAAEKMEFSVREGLFTTINLPDNLNLGYSHFYVEVLRVKKMAEFLRQGKNLFIIFDELFRGTNVKDAYEATVAITGAFAKKRNCMFIVSTHIMEAGDTLREMHKNIRFLYLPTKMNGTHPYYTYTLEEGITADRHGMIIINNEGILDILKKGLTETPVK